MYQFKLLIHLLLLSFIISTDSLALDNREELSIGVPTSLFLPYWGGSTVVPTGIVADIVSLYEKKNNVKIVYKEFNTIHELEKALARNEVDTAILASVNEDDDYIYSDALYSDSVVYWTRPDSYYLDEENIKWACLKGSSLCDILINQGYKNIIEVDDYTKVGELLDSEKIDAIIGYYRSFMYHLNSNEIGVKRIRFKKEFGNVRSNFVINNSNPELKDKLDLFIKEYKENYGLDIETSINRKYSLKNNLYDTWLSSESSLKIRYSIPGDLFPLSFYSEKERRYIGIVHDVFNKVEEFTPFVFEYIPSTKLNYMEMLKNGDIDVIPVFKNGIEPGGLISPFGFFKFDFELIETRKSYSKVVVGVLDRINHFDSHKDIIVYNDQEKIVSDLEKGVITHAYINSELLGSIISSRGDVGFTIVRNNRYENFDFEANMLFRESSHELISFMMESLSMVPDEYYDILKEKYNKVNYTVGYSRVHVEKSIAVIIFLIIVIIFFYRKSMLKLNTKLQGVTNEKNLSDQQRIRLMKLINNIKSMVFISKVNGELLLKNNQCGIESRSIGFGNSDKFISYVKGEISSNDFKEFEFSVKSNHYVVNQKLIEYGDDGIDIVMTVVDNVTSIREREHLLLKAKELSEENLKQRQNFLAVVSHELRTPISGILGLIELISKSSDSAPDKDTVSNARRSIEKLKYLVDDILDYSKIEANQLRIYKEETNLALELPPTIKSFEKLAKSKGLEFRLNWEPSHNLICSIDGLRVNQVLSNVLSNAVKFTSEGFVSLSVMITSDELKLSVCDSGLGMNEKELDVIYNPFVQAQDDISRKYGGTGLGMSIVKNLVELMGGELSISSKKYSGTNIDINIPISVKAYYAKYDREIKIPISKSYRDWLDAFGVEVDEKNWIGDESDFGNIYPDDVIEIISGTGENESRLEIIPLSGHALVVEDDSINKFVIRRQLETLGLEVTIVSNGVSALKLLEKSEASKFDIVITDCHMPKMNGLQFIDQLRVANGAYADVKVIMCTADNSGPTVSKILNSSVNAVLYKPYGLRDLYNELIRHLKIISTTKCHLTCHETLEDWISHLDDQSRLKMAEALKRSLNDAFFELDQENHMIKPVLHRLKGSFGVIGLTEDASICVQLERDVTNIELKQKLKGRIVEILNQIDKFL